MLRRRLQVPVFLLLTVLIPSCSDRVMFGGGEAGALIERHGAAITKPDPNVGVFVPHALGREKNFGDEQLRAIVPALKRLRGFNELDVSRSSVTDAGIRHLRELTELEILSVYETTVTANGLMELQHLPKITLIVISRDQYADDARAALRRAFPTATIHEVGSYDRAQEAGGVEEPGIEPPAPADNNTPLLVTNHRHEGEYVSFQ